MYTCLIHLFLICFVCVCKIQYIVYDKSNVFAAIGSICYARDLCMSLFVYVMLAAISMGSMLHFTVLCSWNIYIYISVASVLIFACVVTHVFTIQQCQQHLEQTDL